VLAIGKPQAIASRIEGTPIGEVQSKTRIGIQASVERLSSVKLRDIGWLESDGLPVLGNARLFHLLEDSPEHGLIIQVGQAFMPGAVQRLRIQLANPDLLWDAGTRGKRPAMREPGWRDGVRLIPVQSRGLTLQSYPAGAAHRNFAAYQRAYNLAHAYEIRNSVTGGQVIGTDLKAPRARKAICNDARLPEKYWDPFVDHIVELEHYVRTPSGLYLSTDRRNQAWKTEMAKRQRVKRAAS
jgi:hypothetical protein